MAGRQGPRDRGRGIWDGPEVLKWREGSQEAAAMVQGRTDRPGAELEGARKKKFQGDMYRYPLLHSQGPGQELQRRHHPALYKSGPGSPAFPDRVDG